MKRLITTKKVTEGSCQSCGAKAGRTVYEFEVGLADERTKSGVRSGSTSVRLCEDCLYNAVRGAMKLLGIIGVSLANAGTKSWY